LFLLIFVDIL